MPVLHLRTVEFSPLVESSYFKDTKDPCPVFDGENWHIFGSGGSSDNETSQILHAISPSIQGPWTELKPALLNITGPAVAAPGVVWDQTDQLLHMFVQINCFGLGGTIEHLVSTNRGETFARVNTVLKSVPETGEAGIYDPHPSEIEGEKCIVYSGMSRVNHPDLYLAKSTTNSWYGPWEKVGKILSHEEISEHHNQHGHPDYEWGLEGAQLLELASGQVLLIAVCFLPFGERGTRQRVFFAIADSVCGPYKSLGPVIDPITTWGSGENGHAAGIIRDGVLHLFYQARKLGGPWCYGQTTFSLQELQIPFGPLHVAQSL